MKTEEVKMTKEDEKWKTEDDLRALLSAEEVKKDSKRMDACKKLAKEKMANMQAIGKHIEEEKGEEE